MTRRDLFRNATATAALGLGPIPLVRAATEPAAPWLGEVYRELHIDAHFGQLPAPYEGFDAERAAALLKDAAFQMVSCFAICNAGYSYFPTKLGVTHPGLKRDFTGEFCAALKKRGIRVLAYVSVGPDRRAYQEHPEWAMVRDLSQPARPRGDVAQMCVNSPWLEKVHIPQLEEIVSLYDVDGFFLDNLVSKFVSGACYCASCRQAFRVDTGREIPTDSNDPNVFAHHQWLSRSGARYAGKVVGRLTAAKAGLTFALNHVWVTRNPVKPPPEVTQLVWEPVPPYSGTLSFDLSLEARYLSSQPGIVNWSCMTTRGNGWGDYSLRDPAAFRHEAAILLANGGRPYFGDDSYPSGNPDPAVYQAFGGVNRRTADLEPCIRGSVPHKETAVLLSADSIWATLPLNPAREWMASPSSPGVAGAHKVLVEEHLQFGILNSDTLADSLQEYRLLVLPEQCILNVRECDAIRRFVHGGGSLLVTGETGIRTPDNQPSPDFSLADVLGVRYLAYADVRRAYLRVRDVPGVPAMDVQISGGYTRVQCSTANTLLEVVPPAGPKQAPAAAADGPGLTLNQFGDGKAIYCAARLFSTYHQDGTPVLRKLAAWMLDGVHPPSQRAMVLEKAPLNLEATLTSRGTERFLHLLNFTGDKRLSGGQRLQDFSAVQGIRAGIHCRSKPKRVLLVPEKRPIAFEWTGERAWFHPQPLVLHDVYLIEG
ncbi:MAG TPA: alpha-amylase family protein [Bryobacteraceae bacterium]|nr:alpha-amylase family protein [Bryobacteraceae bacterium]